MTLLPCSPGDIKIPAQEGWIEKEASWQCENPKCAQRGTETHEVVRRSATAGAKRWVVIDGIVLCNQVRLCHSCHEDVTQHRAWIRFDYAGEWVWFAEHESGEVTNPKSGRAFRRIGPLQGSSEL